MPQGEVRKTENRPKRGRLIVISGPSGVGKGTLCKKLLHGLPHVCLSISATTRSKRPGEVHGQSYFFLTRGEFERIVQSGDMLEYAEYNDCYYGTPRFYVEKQLEGGKDVLLEIETQGALEVKRQFPDEARLIFLVPPSMSILRERLAGRGTNTKADIDSRMRIAEKEMAVREQFDVCIVNDELTSCYQAALEAIE